MNVKGEVLLQLFNKSKLKNGTKMFLDPKFFSIVKFKKLEFSAPLTPTHSNSEKMASSSQMLCQ